MCTYIDKKVSDAFRKKIKKNGIGYAWKLVKVNADGEYISPFQSNYLYNKKFNKCPTHSDFQYYLSRKMIAPGAFHLFSTRDRARKVLKWIANPINDDPFNFAGRYNPKNFKYRVIKVSFKPSAFIAAGPVDLDWKHRWGFNSKTDSVCVKSFKFVK